MATYTTQYRGNTALQTELWNLTLAEAEAATRSLLCTVGSYWHQNLLKPLRRAKRAHVLTVKVYTAHFSTSELANALACADIVVTCHN